MKEDVGEVKVEKDDTYFFIFTTKNLILRTCVLNLHTIRRLNFLNVLEKLLNDISHFFFRNFFFLDIELSAPWTVVALPLLHVWQKHKETGVGPECRRHRQSRLRSMVYWSNQNSQVKGRQ